MLHLVLDTNTALSGLLWSGTPKRLIIAARAGEIALFCSVPLLEELGGVILYRIPIITATEAVNQIAQSSRR